MTTGPARRLVRSPDEMELRSVRRYSVPAGALWRYLTDPDELGRWFGRWSGDQATGTVDVLMSAEGDAPAPEPAARPARDPGHRSGA